MKILKKIAITLLMSACYLVDLSAQGLYVHQSDATLGTWVGTIRRQAPDSTIQHTSSILWRIHKIDFNLAKVQLSQVADYNDPIKQSFTSRFYINGSPSIDDKGKHYLTINAGDATNGKCNFTLELALSGSGEKEYLKGSFNEATRGCYNTTMSFRRIDRDTSDYSYASKQTGAAVASYSPEPVRSSVLNKDLKIIATANYVTHFYDKGFKWYDINKAPEALRSSFQKINISSNETVQSFIAERIKNGCQIQVAAIDLDGDGDIGVMVGSSGNYCCGSAGCSYDLYEDSGKKYISVSDYEIRPTYNGIVTSQNVIIRYQPNNLINNTMVHEDVGLNNNYPLRSILGKRGATTPDGLGRILLTALKTNDLKLWMTCTHPESTVATAEFNERRFKEFRLWLEEDGVSDWTKVKFNRVTFTKNGFQSLDDGVVGGEQFRRNFRIEFNYGDEYIGGLGTMTIGTNKGNKFLIWSPGKDTGMVRKKRERSRL